MRRRKVRTSAMGKIVEYKLDPGVFVIEFPGTKQKVSLGQPPDAVKRFQQVGYAGENGISTFVIADSKTQGESISWNLVEFPLLYALYFILVKKNGNMMPAFFAGPSSSTRETSAPWSFSSSKDSASSGVSPCGSPATSTVCFKVNCSKSS